MPNDQLLRVFDYHNGRQVRTVIKDGEPWFVGQDPTSIKECLPTGSEFCGYLYAIEYGQYLKIGRTRTPYQRIKSIASQAKNYAEVMVGRFAVSKPHTNFVENERLLHEHFRYARRNGELFEVTLDDFLNNLPPMRFLDETEKLRKRNEATIEFLKSFLFGGQLNDLLNKDMAAGGESK